MTMQQQAITRGITKERCINGTKILGFIATEISRRIEAQLRRELTPRSNVLDRTRFLCPCHRSCCHRSGADATSQFKAKCWTLNYVNSFKNDIGLSRCNFNNP